MQETSPATAAAAEESVNSRITAMHYVTPRDRVLLVITGKCRPGNVPEHVNFGTMNSAWTRMRLGLATAAMGFMLYYSDVAINMGRAEREST